MTTDFENIQITGVGGGSCYRLHWKDRKAFLAEVVIIVLTHGNNHKFIRAIESIHAQETISSVTALVLGDGNSDEWIYRNKEHLNKSNVIYAESFSGKAWVARNLGHSIVKKYFNACKWICRLDCDDYLESKNSLQSILSSIKDSSVYWMLAGNRQSKGGNILPVLNMPQPQLLDADYLLNRLEKMAQGDFSAELPSCNLWIRSDFSVCYPSVESAEDHWLLVYLLLHHSKRGLILSKCLFSVYSLSGTTTKVNRKKGAYPNSRNSLLRYAEWVFRGEISQSNSETVLGWGCEGTVFYRDKMVKKVFYKKTLSTQHVNWLKCFPMSVSFPSFKVQQENGQDVIMYSFEDSQICTSVSLAQLSDFIVECLSKKVVALNIVRKNFRIKQGKLWFIDIGRDVVPFEIHYFKDMCARLFLLFEKQWSDEKLAKHTKELRSDDQFMTSISDFETFFSQCISKFVQRIGFFQKPPLNPIKKTYYHSDVTLMIKVCAMDHRDVTRNLEHILTQMTLHDSFYEIIVLADSRKDDFLRQYSNGNLPLLLDRLNDFKQANKICRILLSPDSKQQNIINATNERWFGFASKATRNKEGVPVFPQIWGFEQVNTPFLLQMDIDVIIHRGTEDYNVIDEMKQAILEKKDILGAGFNIPQDSEDRVKKWHAQPGEFVPEVRFGLLYLERILTLRPFPNIEKKGTLGKSWYRSVEKFQQNHGYKSLRGGRGTTYYIHTPNEFKNDPIFLNRVYDLVEQGILPSLQKQKWDITAGVEDWKYPPRNEEFVFILLCSEPDFHWTRALIKSIKSQNHSSWGCIVLDSTQNKSFSIWLRNEFSDCYKNITFVHKFLNSETQKELLLEISHNSRSLLILLNYYDCLINDDALETIYNILNDDDQAISLGEYQFKHPLSKLKIHYRIQCLRSGVIRSEKFALFDKWMQSQLYMDELNLEPKILNEYVILTNRETEQKQVSSVKRKTAYLPNMHRIEIDLTYKCNLRCTGCSRSSAQVPEDLHIEMRLIDKFLEETEKKGIVWDRVALLGGEPTLHPQFLKIIEKLDNWFLQNSPHTEVKVISNGSGPKVQDQLNKMPPRWFYDKSFKQQQKKGISFDYFKPFNAAPIDDVEWAREDFSKGCWITQDSGIGLAPFGYFPCAISGGIERIMKLGLGKSEIPDDSFDFLPVLNEYCQYCGCFRNDSFQNREQQTKISTDAGTVSETWRKSYSRYQKKLISIC